MGIGGATLYSRTYSTSYQYDGSGQILKITYPSGRVVDYVRWPNRRIKQVKATFNGVTTTLIGNVGYYPFGPAETIDYGNGLSQHRTLTTTYAVDEVQLLETGGGPALDHRDYAQDAAGNITAVTDVLSPGHSRSYGYDALDRLNWDSGVSSTSPTYSYDANGNRLQRVATEAGFTGQVLTYGANSNRLSTFNGAPVSHDGMGNLTAGAGAASYGYDAGGRLAEVQGGEVLDLRYSGLGELASTRRGSATEDYTLAVDGRALELESRSDGRVVADWVWLDELPAAQIEDRYDALGGYLGSTVTYLHADHLGTPRLGTDGAKAIVWRYESDGFGVGTSAGTVEVRLRLPGQVALGIAGLHYNYFRDYDPQLGRYVESDPIGLVGGLNTYAYVLANPLSYTDPMGLDLTVSFDGSSALGAGHVGIGVNSPNTVGQRPQPGQNPAAIATGQDVPGQISPDPAPDLRVVIPTMPRQDRQAQQCIDQRARERQDYNLYNNNCAQFVSQCLRAAGVSVPDTRYPRTLFRDLQRRFDGGQ